MLLTHPPITPWIVRHAHGVTVVLLSDQADLVDAQVRVQPDNEEEFVALQPRGRSGSLHRYEATIPWDDANPATLYCFRVLHAGRTHWLSADGRQRFLPAEATMFRVSRQAPPAWVADQIFYQVFPDRFARAEGVAEPTDDAHPARPMVRLPWGAPLAAEHAAHTFYGGNLDGAQQQLNHIQQTVGATALYLNPVFASSSSHRYDTDSYDTVDPALGGNPALVRLAQGLRGRGMRLVLDAVVNHTGANHHWFNRWGVHDTVGAAQSAESPWRRWYAFDAQGAPIGWKGHASLPVLDFAEPAVQHAVYAGPDAVLRRWLRPPVSADGWRLDVVHMLGEGPGAHNNAHHVRAIRRAISEENPEAYVLGEHFAEATRWLQGDQEHGAMNYHGFALPVWGWLAGDDDPGRLSTADFDAWATRACASIGYDHQLVQFNLLGSHDTQRVLTRFGGDVQRVKLAMTLLFSWAGVPCIYYGDELGMAGGPDPDCRRCMDWSGDTWHRELLAHVRSLATLRQQRPEWRRGALQMLATGPDWMAYARFNATSASIACINRGAAVEVRVPVSALPTPVQRWQADAPWDLHDGVLRLALPAHSSLVVLGESH